MKQRHYAPEAFSPDGSLLTTLPPDVVSTLGKYGMVHPFMDAEVPSTAQEKRIDIEKRAREAEKAKSARIQEEIMGFLESKEGKKFRDIYEATLKDISKITELVGEKPPTLESSSFLELTPSLMRSYALFEELNLKPKLVLAPAHRSEQWWKDLWKAFEESPLNPPIQYANHAVRGGGLNVSEIVSRDWEKLTDYEPSKSNWSLCVMSGMNRSNLTNVTTYGYVDSGNTRANNSRLNDILLKLDRPTLSARADCDPLIQPDIHPTLEAYMTYHLTRILNETSDSFMDEGTFSWIQGTVDSGNFVPGGSWYLGEGMLELWHSTKDYVKTDTGILPTARGTSL